MDVFYPDGTARTVRRHRAYRGPAGMVQHDAGQIVFNADGSARPLSTVRIRSSRARRSASRCCHSRRCWQRRFALIPGAHADSQAVSGLGRHTRMNPAAPGPRDDGYSAGRGSWMKQLALIVLGALVALTGAVWTLQGLGYINGSFMTGATLLGGHRADRPAGRARDHCSRAPRQAAVREAAARGAHRLTPAAAASRRGTGAAA